MISIPVKKRRILGGNKGDMWVLYPVIIWLVVTLTTFIVAMVTDSTVLLLMFFVFSLSIIPIFALCYKKSKKFRGDNALYVEEVTFCAKEGVLYGGDTKLPNIYVDRKERCIYINDVVVLKSEVKGIPISTQKASFIGTIEEPYYDEFLKFLRANGIEMSGRKGK